MGGKALLLNELMHYLPTPSQTDTVAPLNGADKYYGAVAAGYETKRKDDLKWQIEQTIIEGLLSELPEGAEVLDCPVGTGRFLNFYKDHGVNFTGIDKSCDMLIQSARKIMPEADIEKWVQASNAADKVLPLAMRLPSGKHCKLVHGDVLTIHTGGKKSFDAAVMCRLTRWLSPEECQTAIRNLTGMCRSRVIWTARVANHPHARTKELFEAALSGWKITRDIEGYVPDYRIMMAEPIWEAA